MLCHNGSSFSFYCMDIDPDEITSNLNITPTHILRKGDWIIEKRGIKAKCNKWLLKTDYKSLPVEE